MDPGMQTNLDSVFYLCRTAARTMIRQRYGRIISVGSVVGLRGQAGQCNYAASRAALVGFTKACAGTGLTEYNRQPGRAGADRNGHDYP